MLQTKIICHKCSQPKLKGEWGKIENPRVLARIERGRGSYKADYKIVEGNKLYFECETCIETMKVKSRKKNEKAKIKTKEKKELLKKFEKEIEPIKEKLEEHDKKIYTNKVVIDRLSEKVYCPSRKDLYQQHQRLKKWEDRNFNIKMRIKDFAPQFEKIVKRRKELDEFKAKAKNSFFSHLGSEHMKKRIDECWTIWGIKKLTSWTVWRTDTPQSRLTIFIYLFVPFLLFLAKLRYWKKFKAWYHAPLDEEDWVWEEDELDEEEKL